MTRSTIARLITPAVLTAGLATAAFAATQVDPGLTRAFETRHAHMSLYAFNLSTLGGMAQDKIPYDAEAATRAASNLAALAAIDQTGYWPEGSDASVIEDSRAKAEIWTDMDEFRADQTALVEATATLAGAAGTDLDSLKAAFGPVGAACGDCHETFRAAEE